MDFLVNFYICLFYTSLIFICYYILGFFIINKPLLSSQFFEVGQNFILASWIVILFYFCYRLFIDNEMNNTPLIKYKNIYKEAETGDLIIYRWNIVDVGFRMFSKFSHVGMIVKKNNKLYLLETHPDENKNKKHKKNNDGVHLYLLKNRIEDYDGECFLAKLNTNCDREQLTNNIIKNLNEYKNIPFDASFRDLFVYNYFRNFITRQSPASSVNSVHECTVPNKQTMFCSEFIAYVLYKNSIYTHDKNLASLNPGSFLHLTKNNKPLYKSLKKIIF